jgi:membrane-bound inhibitor of C-type lysozyme
VTRRELIVAVACALSSMLASGAASADAGETPFVITYRCDGDRHIAVGYPAFRDVRAPVRISWQGRTVELAPTRVGSGARYINAAANLEWWSKGKGGTLSQLDNNRPLLTNCVES